MDISFDAYGGGWNDEQVGANQSGLADPQGGYTNTQTAQRTSALEKIPLPVSVGEVLQVPESEERYDIGSYHFNTLRIVGQIVEVHAEVSDCKTYQLCEVNSLNPKTAPTFTVVRYQGIDSNQDDPYTEGSVVQAVGKLRSFNSRLSLISFHIREVNSEEVQIFELEARVAKIYYARQISEKTEEQLDHLKLPIFSTHAPVRGIFNGGISQLNATPSRVTQKPSEEADKLYKQPSKGANDRGLVGQKARIYEYIKEHGGTVEGVSVGVIESNMKLDSNFRNDITYLSNEGIIFNTVSDDHYAVIE